MTPHALRRKRVLDLSLLLLTAPAFLAAGATLALVVWAVDGRPVFFRQMRLGLHQRPFLIWKLRTMTREEDVAARRPTRLGAWLRQRGLDEIPQLIDVLLGRMSLVGPRPLTPSDAARLGALDPCFAQRFASPPGITGLPQVCGARGAALTAALDAHYARTSSVRVDLALLFRTAYINVVGKAKGRLSLPAELKRL